LIEGLTPDVLGMCARSRSPALPETCSEMITSSAAAGLRPDDLRAQATFVATVVSLAATSIFLSRVGVTRVANTLARNVLVGLAAMGLGLLAGWLLRP
jgi:hypothetical protein